MRKGCETSSLERKRGGGNLILTVQTNNCSNIHSESHNFKLALGEFVFRRNLLRIIIRRSQRRRILRKSHPQKESLERIVLWRSLIGIIIIRRRCFLIRKKSALKNKKELWKWGFGGFAPKSLFIIKNKTNIYRILCIGLLVCVHNKILGADECS